MIPSECQAIENPDEAVLGTSYRLPVQQVTDAPHIDVKDLPPGTCFCQLGNFLQITSSRSQFLIQCNSVLCTEDKEHKNDSIISDITLQLKEPRSSFHDQDYVEKIEEFQIYLKMVRKIARPGCSPETLNLVLSSMSSLVDTLSDVIQTVYTRVFVKQLGKTQVAAPLITSLL